jgi:hypothetical protein
MFNHQIEEMTDAVAKQLELSDVQRAAVKTVLGLYWFDKIAIVWTADDVRSCKKGITEDDAVEALQQVLHHHDATLGVTWDTIVSACGGEYPNEDDEEEEPD